MRTALWIAAAVFGVLAAVGATWYFVRRSWRAECVRTAEMNFAQGRAEGAANAFRSQQAAQAPEAEKPTEKPAGKPRPAAAA